MSAVLPVSPVSREKILTTARLLPAAPQVLSGLCELLQDANSDLEQVANQIRVDSALSARVIRISNSPVYGGVRIGSVDEAVNRVGFGEILRLVGIAAVAGLADRAMPFYGIGAERMREALIIHALAAESLARYADVNPREAYTGGLLRTLGIMVLDRVARDRRPEPEHFDPQRFVNYHAWEAAVFGVNSNDVTTTVLDEWRFSPELVIALQRHFLMQEEDYNDRLACVLNLAGSIVFDAGLALPGEVAWWEPSATKLSATGITAEQMREAAEEVRVHFERQRSAFG